MSEKVQFFVDGRPAEGRKGAMVLDVLEEMGVHVPTLCHHPSLEPSGACRLCVVEITHPDWGGWSGLVTSCLYPIEEGLQVSTRSTRVMDARRTLLEMYLARCPDSEEVKAVARGEGVDATPFPAREGADDCVMCGLCIRVCQDLGPAAIAPFGRGTDKEVAPRPDRVGEDCTACGACALVCPTGEIRMDKKDGKFHIWNREFDIPVCRVDPELCRGCGVCEEVCPIAVPRIQAFKTGAFVSIIAPEACTGCGICAGACPAGAISQEEHAGVVEGGLRDKTVVFACSRSPFPREAEGVITIPCVGRVTVESMLACLARGAKGVLLMCRDKETCPSGPGGTLGERRVAAAETLAESLGLGRGRVEFAWPRPGMEGPVQALAEYAARLEPSPLRDLLAAPASESCGLDRALETARWFKERPELDAKPPRDLEGIFDGSLDGADTLLYLGDLPDLDLLLSLVVHEWRLKELFEDAALLLKNKGIKYNPVVTARAVDASPARRVVTFHKMSEGSFKGRKECVTLDELAGGEAESAPVEGFRFRITQKERRELLEEMKASPGTIRCASPYEVAQRMLLKREGSWQVALLPEPVMAFSEALRTRAGEIES